MKRRDLLLALILAFMGIADSWHMTASASSSIPFAVLGVVLYALIFAAAGGLLVLFDQRVLALLRVCSLLGALTSLGYVFVQLVLGGATDVYRLISALLSIGILGVVGKLSWGSRVREPVVVPWGTP